MYREVLMALNWGIAEAVYGEMFLNMPYGICHYWIKKGLPKKSCRFLGIRVRVDRSTEHLSYENFAGTSRPTCTTIYDSDISGKEFGHVTSYGYSTV